MKQALLALYRYSLEWKQEVNCGKIKIVIFSRGKVRGSNYSFQFGEKEIGIVSEYKYLGVLFAYNGRFRKGQLELEEQAPVYIGLYTH